MPYVFFCHYDSSRIDLVLNLMGSENDDTSNFFFSVHNKFSDVLIWMNIFNLDW